MAVTQSHYRWGKNELAESTHTFWGAEDTTPISALPLATTILLRFTLQCNASGLNDIDAEFQYRLNGGTWTNITTATSYTRAQTPSCWANGDDCTKRLGGTGTFTANNDGCTTDGISGGVNNDIVANGNSETEIAITLRAVDLQPGDVLEFRLTRDGGTLLDTYSVTPKYVTATNGLLNQTLDAATLVSAGTVDVAGALSKTLDAATLVSAGTVDVAGALSKTLDALTANAAGTVDVAGALGSTLAPLTTTVTGTVDVVGESAASLGTLQVLATGTVAIAGEGGGTLAALTLLAAGTVGAGLTPIDGQVVVTLDALTLVGAGTVVVAPVIAADTAPQVTTAWGTARRVEGRATVRRSATGAASLVRRVETHGRIGRTIEILVTFRRQSDLLGERT